MDSDFDTIARLEELADYVVPLTIRAVCELGLADRLREGPRAVEEIAAETGTLPGPLGRALRALAAKGLFVEVEPGTFELTPTGQLLRGDHPWSLRDGYPLLAPDLRAWARVDHTLRTGRSAFEHVHGQPYYDYLGEHPDEQARFDGSVETQNRVMLRFLLPAYDWSRCGTIVDVASGNGAFVAGLLARHPALRGVAFDLPHVVAGARAVLEAAGVADRCEVVTGSFFDGVPEGGDTYLLKTILHDWDDERATEILGAVAGAMQPDGRVIVLEALLPPLDEFHLGKLLDVNSLVLVAGHDRDVPDYERLFAAAGLGLAGVTRTTTLAVLEARRVA